MKIFKKILPIAAFAFAFAGAFATVANVAVPEFIAPLNSTMPCTQIAETCGVNGQFTCLAVSRSSGQQFRVYDNKVGTACANLLTRNVNAPISIP